VSQTPYRGRSRNPGLARKTLTRRRPPSQRRIATARTCSAAGAARSFGQRSRLQPRSTRRSRACGLVARAPRRRHGRFSDSAASHLAVERSRCAACLRWSSASDPATCRRRGLAPRRSQGSAPELQSGRTQRWRQVRWLAPRWHLHNRVADVSPHTPIRQARWGRSWTASPRTAVTLPPWPPAASSFSTWRPEWERRRAERRRWKPACCQRLPRSRGGGTGIARRSSPAALPCGA